MPDRNISLTSFIYFYDYPWPRLIDTKNAKGIDIGSICIGDTYISNAFVEDVYIGGICIEGACISSTCVRDFFVENTCINSDGTAKCLRIYLQLS